MVGSGQLESRLLDLQLPTRACLPCSILLNQSAAASSLPHPVPSSSPASRPLLPPLAAHADLGPLLRLLCLLICHGVLRPVCRRAWSAGELLPCCAPVGRLGLVARVYKGILGMLAAASAHPPAASVQAAAASRPHLPALLAGGHAAADGQPVAASCCGAGVARAAHPDPVGGWGGREG